MAEEEKQYTLTTADGQTLTSSHGYSGQGTATYANGETYEGNFFQGVENMIELI